MEKDILHGEENLFKPMDELQIPEPSVNLRNEFLHKIDQMSSYEQPGSKIRLVSVFLKVAIVFLVFISGWLASLLYSNGNKDRIEQLQNQLDQNNKLLVLSLIQQSSSSDRLQAVQVSYSLHSIDNQIVSALINGLMLDNDPNVRMKCAESLALHLKPDSLNSVFAKALQYQDDPFIQLRLIDFLSNNRSSETIQLINNFLNSGKADEYVSSEVKKTLNL